jgi:hypothetical protein
MDKNVSIVKVDKRSYRAIARENWGLTKEQMKGKHVHHRIKRSDGGTNDPSNLYVCSEWFHNNVWHAEEGGFTGLASEAGKKGGKKAQINLTLEQKSENGKKAASAAHAVRTPEQKLKYGRKGAEIVNASTTPEQKSERTRKTNAEKDENGKSINAKKGATALHAQRWKSTIDGFVSTAGPVAHHNKSRGWDPNARVRIS